MGNEYGTTTAFPRWRPGFIFGNMLITRAASFSNLGCGARDRTPVTFPFLSILKMTLIRCFPDNPKSPAKSVLNFFWTNFSIFFDSSAGQNF